jgi:ribosomal-protein-alanine N-acetyltransferase
MKFEVLSIEHLTQLLNFELENRSWFESLIEPRGDNFYTETGVKMHIGSLIENMQAGTAYCGVLVHNSKIVARANLKDIAKQHASVGYRVSKQYISQGIASQCLSKLIEISSNKLNIETLDAYVLENNPASKRVLCKHGFKQTNNVPKSITINSEKVACSSFRLSIEQQPNK